MRIVEISWLDSVVLDCGGWVDLDDVDASLAPSAMRHRTIGYLIAESPSAVAVASSIGDQPDVPTVRVQGVVVIPRVAIEEIREPAGNTTPTG